jgi:hypothetical protein
MKIKPRKRRKRRHPEASDLNKYSETFFKSFNLAMQAAYNACLKIAEERSSDVSVYSSNDDLQTCLDNEYKKWLSEPLQGTAKTPSEYLDGVGFDEIIEMFGYGAEICDDDLPQIYVEKLLGYGDDAVNFLAGTTVHITADADEGDMVQSVMAAKLLGRHKIETAVLPLISSLDRSQGAPGLMQETARDALVNIGKAAVDPILREMSAGKLSHEACEYLAMSLAEIGKHCRSDEIYSVLKKTFNELPDKAVTASCLAKYGDGRAIPALRGYLLKSGGKIDKVTFYDIVSAVRQLGGRIDDLKQVPEMY